MSTLPRPITVQKYVEEFPQNFLFFTMSPCNVQNYHIFPFYSQARKKTMLKSQISKTELAFAETIWRGSRVSSSSTFSNFLCQLQPQKNSFPPMNDLICFPFSFILLLWIYRWQPIPICHCQTNLWWMPAMDFPIHERTYSLSTINYLQRKF